MSNKELSSQSKSLLQIITYLESKDEVITTKMLTELRGTRTGPTNRMLQRLRRKGYVELVLDPVGDKAARQWRLSR